jgi:hypothetical protein
MSRQPDGDAPLEQAPDDLAHAEEQALRYGYVYQANHQAAYRLALLLCGGDADRAAEVTRAAFVEVYGPWYRGTTDDYGDDLRRALVEGALGRGWLARLRRPPAGAPVNGDPLWRALSALSPVQRAAVVLHHYDGQPVETVARLLRTATAGVVAELHRARDRLRENLGSGVSERYVQ